MKKKFKYIFPCLILLFTFFCSSAFAVSYEDKKFPDFPEDINLSNCIITHRVSDCSYRLYYFNELQDFTYYNFITEEHSSTKLDGYSLCVNGTGGSSYAFFPKTSDSWTLTTSYSGAWILYGLDNDTEIVYSGFDLIYPDTNETFFQGTPWTGSIAMQSLITRNFWQPVSKTLNVLVSLGTLLLGSLISVILLRRFLTQ